MSEATTIATIAAPIVVSILEDLHTATSAEITRLEANAPAELASAATHVQTYVTDLINSLHGLVARIDGHRGTVTPTPAPAPVPATPNPAPAAPAK